MYNESRRQAANHPLYFLILDPPATASSSSGKLLLYNIGEDSHAFTKSVSVPSCYEEISTSSSGLVCLHGVRNRRVAICNPVSEEIIPLPDFPEPRRPFDHAGIDSFTTNLVGFGFHAQTNKYKVVQLVHNPSKGAICNCYVLTVERRAESSWGAVDASLLDCVPSRLEIDGAALCANGALYWESYFPKGGDFAQILEFDLGNDSLKIILSPRVVDSSEEPYGYFKHLAELQGNLCFAEMISHSGSLQVDISMLNRCDDNVQCWSHLYTLDLELYVGGSPLRSYEPFFPLCVRSDWILLMDDEALYSYDFKEKSLVAYKDNGDYTVFRNLLEGRAIVHAETLVVLN